MHDGFVLVLSLITSMMRSTSHCKSRLLCLDCFLFISEYVSDEIKLNRIVPYILDLLNTIQNSTHNAFLAAQSIKILSIILGSVQSLGSVINSRIFPEYIIPTLSRYVEAESELPKIMLAQCLSSLGNTAKMFLELSQQYKPDWNKRISVCFLLAYYYLILSPKGNQFIQ